MSEDLDMRGYKEEISFDQHGENTSSISSLNKHVTSFDLNEEGNSWEGNGSSVEHDKKVEAVGSSSTNIKGPVRQYVRSKMPRLRWTRELHHAFVNTIERLGGHDSKFSKLFQYIYNQLIWYKEEISFDQHGENTSSISSLNKHVTSFDLNEEANSREGNG
ncbi:putative transcription regulator Homeodomain-LIKE family [Helianthus annuus]|nr:putative transcription regulator Homeodomain-LIKE family [Helianthus annuus]